MAVELTRWSHVLVSDEHLVLAHQDACTFAEEFVKREAGEGLLEYKAFKDPVRSVTAISMHHSAEAHSPTVLTALIRGELDKLRTVMGWT